MRDLNKSASSATIDVLNGKETATAGEHNGLPRRANFCATEIGYSYTKPFFTHV